MVERRGQRPARTRTTSARSTCRTTCPCARPPSRSATPCASSTSPPASPTSTSRPATTRCSTAMEALWERTGRGEDLRHRRARLAPPRRGLRRPLRAAARPRVRRDLRRDRQLPVELADAAGHRAAGATPTRWSACSTTRSRSRRRSTAATSSTPTRCTCAPATTGPTRTRRRSAWRGTAAPAARRTSRGWSRRCTHYVATSDDGGVQLHLLRAGRGDGRRCPAGPSGCACAPPTRGTGRRRSTSTPSASGRWPCASRRGARARRLTRRGRAGRRVSDEHGYVRVRRAWRPGTRSS